MDNKQYFEIVYIAIKKANLADTNKTDRFDSLIYRVMDDLKSKNPNWVKENDILEMIIKTVALDNKIDEKDWDYYGERLKKNKGVENYMDVLSKESLKDQMKEGRIIKITESDLKRIVKRVIKENENHWEEFGFEDEKSFIDDYVVADEYANDLYWDLSNDIEHELNNCIENMNLPQMISDYQNQFIQKYGKYVNIDADIYNDYIDSLLSIDGRYVDVGDLSSALTVTVFEWLEKNLKNN